MHTITYTHNGASIVRCYTMRRSNAEAIAQGARMIAVHDGYLIFPQTRSCAFNARWLATKSAMLRDECEQARADTVLSIAAFN